MEIIEMGVVTDPFLAGSATIVDSIGIPSNCAALAQALLPGGRWADNPSDGISAATGGLFGHGLIVDVAQGTAISYRADSIDNFYAEGDFLHTDPGNRQPSMASANPKSLIIDSGKAIESTWNSGEDAISALFMHDQIINEFVLGSGINAKTEWVVTFPTKHIYANDTEVRPPFNSLFLGPEGACENIRTMLYDRETQTIDATGSVGGFIPRQPQICWNTNIFQMYNSAIGQASEVPSLILGSTNIENINTNPFESGVMFLEFPDAQPLMDANNNYAYNGYPVTGFAVQTYTNSNAQPGLLAQYAAIFSHTNSRSITSSAE